MVTYVTVSCNSKPATFCPHTMCSCVYHFCNKTAYFLSWSWHVYFQLRTAAFKAYCAIWVRCSNFRHQASPRVSPHESTQRRRVELWASNVREFCLNADLQVTFRDLLHALLPLRRKACWGFFCPKNPTASAGCEPANFGTKGQHTTSRPPKPLWNWHSCLYNGHVHFSARYELYHSCRLI